MKENLSGELRDKVSLLRGKIRSQGYDLDLYQELSDLLFQYGKISAAINILEKSFHQSHEKANGLADPLNPALHDARWYFDRGLEFADAFLYEDAIECLQLACDQGLDNFETHYCLAGVYKSLEQMSLAELHCRKSLELNSRFAPAYILLGSLLKKPGRLEECIASCKRAVLIDPGCLAAYYDLACYYSLLDKNDQALASLEMALCKGFTDFHWLNEDPDLQALRSSPEFHFLLQSYRHK